MTKLSVRMLAIFSLAVMMVIILATPVLAFDARSGNTVTIGSGEVINGDLYLAGSSIQVDGTVNGDIFAAGMTININGTINGGVTLAGQTITINGKVSSGARAAGQTINCNGSIGRDLVTVSSNLNINSGSVIGGDLAFSADQAIINGHISGNVIDGGNDVTIAGRVDKDVTVTVNNLTISSTAVISGVLVYVSANNASIRTGSIITGGVQHKFPETRRTARDVFLAGLIGNIVARIIGFLSLFIIGLIIIFLAARNIKLLSAGVGRYPAQSLGWGALIFFATPIAAFIVMFTVIGIPLALISMLIYGILLVLSQLPVALIIGWLILRGWEDTDSRGFLIGALALGLFILWVITAIPIFGWIIWLFVAFFGLGSLVTCWRARMTGR